MKGRMCRILMATLVVTIWVSVMSKPLSTYDAANQQVDSFPIQDVPGTACDSTQGRERMDGRARVQKEIFRGLSRLGSTPPRCEHKCGGCVPCNPIQIPTTNVLLGVRYASYKPEGWKCKCGTSYFNP
ncbi:hypothetical protein L6164_011749 [Bauhinia variegata]|uniref:Uncharacterized protein n=1 Tax=Bauhinia variegata TaxID=167791 RepID=A0ACB9P6X4_BAUVA|nr:hypothetical protein L6164_011749 [Bauhinia variegata]